MADQLRVGEVYETYEVREKGIPDGTQVKILSVDPNGDVTVERASGSTVVLQASQIRPSNDPASHGRK